MEEPAPARGAVLGFKRPGPELREALHQALLPGITAEPSETGPDADTSSALPLGHSALRRPQQDDRHDHAELVKALLTERAQRTETALGRTMLMIALCVLLAAVAITIPGVTIAAVLSAIHASPPEVVGSVLATEAVAMKFFTTVIRLLWDRTEGVRHEGRSK